MSGSNTAFQSPAATLSNMASQPRDADASTHRPAMASLSRCMEARLCADFSDVRVHTGADAQRSAQELGARAYTSGTHVVLGDGSGDRHTLARELTHVTNSVRVLSRAPTTATDCASATPRTVSSGPGEDNAHPCPPPPGHRRRPRRGADHRHTPVSRTAQQLTERIAAALAPDHPHSRLRLSRVPGSTPTHPRDGGGRRACHHGRRTGPRTRRRGASREPGFSGGWQ
ncbi:DUF4157 domain-containing protein [Streptomyces sp. NPDC094438]|uniref:eCIS core domain-containing protein n=1 Tax=Streptomyces sp. NPDC094438 TaxID=3366061 RepID=UPI003804BD80